MFEERKNIIFPIIIASFIVAVSAIVYVSNIFSSEKIVDPHKKTISFDKRYLKPVSLIKAPERKLGSKDPFISASNVALIDTMSMYLVYGMAEKAEVPIASLTKLMTALIVVEKYDLTEKIKIDKNDVAVDGSKVGFLTDEEVTIDDILNGLLIVSGNDAAMALSHHGMETSGFVNLMNEKAQKLGMKQTHFLDPSGLNDQGKSSAYDIAILLSQAIKNEKIASIITKADETIKSLDGSQIHDLKNSNRLVTDEMHYDGIIGGKTGFTPDAGHSLASAARINGRIMVGVVLNTADTSKAASAIESKKLFDWARNSLIFEQ